MSNEGEPIVPATQPSFSGGPPKPFKITARNVEGRPDDGAKVVYLVEPVAVCDLARFLHLKTFKVVADLMEMGLFKTADETVDFETASIVARKHGCKAERPPPGMLVL